MPYASAQISIPLRCRRDRLSTKPSELGFRESTFRHITQVLRGNRLGIVSLFPALPACYFPLPLSIPGRLVNLEMFLLISPDHFGDAVVTVTAHCPFDVGIEHPLLGLVRSGQDEDFLDGVMAASAWTEAVACSLELRLPGWFKSIFDHCLKAAIHHDGDSERPSLVVGFWNVDSSHRFGFPEGVVGEKIDHSSSGRWRFDDQLVHPRRVFASIDLRYSSDTDQPIGVAFQHEFLERAHLVQGALLCCPKDAASQVTNSPIGFTPVDGVPVGLLLGSVCR